MQLKYHMVTIEDLVPEEHLLRKVDAALDLSFVYEETAHLYNQKYGRPPIDPVVMVKYVLAGFLCGIPSERQIEQLIRTDMCQRQSEIVRKRRRNFVIFGREGNKLKRFLAQKVCLQSAASGA